ncbi:nucleotide sugar dehydrogenase [Urbifossiella limnaea]|uniref:UDP-N-acetyl-D-glucosamine 6-dehydrogenase n=1 Tax=Urbifossiella limnaea TaxID=2528023 RepID=A0A517Y246_9BACT|nr:nucleotide sugar dehydrogenase [Urbifossiella limnaea]QDU23832.1 UDP-N-acetyl-D-glucosamine 6-dehydrogenase [Urbifossiella limnaea]
MTDAATTLIDKIRHRTARVGIIGLGYVGLPLARAFARTGFRVLGFDIDPHKVAKLNAGKSYIKQFPDATIAGMREKGFEATDRFDRLGEADAVLICVPTPLTDAREPDLRYVEESAHAVAAQLRPGQLVVLESTTYPTTTRGVVLPILERTGLEPGKDFLLAFSPEREDPGNATFSVNNIPKVVGGLDAGSGDAACALYSAVVPQVVRVNSPETAEACKILENTYRAVNIALVNELKVLYDRMGIDVWEVIDAAKTKPFGFQAFYPGPGLGGHCIPVDPFYLTWVARKYGCNTRFIELAGEVNTGMPAFVVTKLADALNDAGKAVKGSKVAMLGVAYKKDVDDPRESPSFELLDKLIGKGAKVTYNDPHVPELPRMRHWPQLPAMASQAITPEYLAAQDAVLIATDHTAYDYDQIVRHSRLVIDTRNATRNVRDGRDKVVRA